MKRRQALSAFAVLAALPCASFAQTPRRVGMFTWSGAVMKFSEPGGTAFRMAMKELGHVEGRDVVYEGRYWDRPDQAQQAARDILRWKPDVLVAAGPPSIAAAKAASDSVPIVMMYSAEPVAMGIVRSLAQPGGNITGLTYDHGFDTSVKSLQLLREALPRLRRVALVWDRTDPVHPVYERHFARAAGQAGLTLISMPLGAIGDIEAAFKRSKEERAEALVVLPSAQITIPNRHAIMRLAARDRVPTLVNIVDGRDYPDALLQYGPNYSGMPRRAAAFVDRILKGARPGDLPVEQPDKYDTIVHLNAARKLGIKLPHSLIVRADRVIE